MLHEALGDQDDAVVATLAKEGKGREVNCSLQTAFHGLKVSSWLSQLLVQLPQAWQGRLSAAAGSQGSWQWHWACLGGTGSHNVRDAQHHVPQRHVLGFGLLTGRGKGKGRSPQPATDAKCKDKTDKTDKDKTYNNKQLTPQNEQPGMHAGHPLRACRLSRLMSASCGCVCSATSSVRWLAARPMRRTKW